MKPLIINSPSLQSLKQKYISAALTFIFWILWFYLWIPVITLLSWWAGADMFYLQMIELGGVELLFQDLEFILKCIALLGGSLAVWAAYNYYRFRNLERRTPLPNVSKEALAQHFGIDPKSLTDLQNAKYINVQFDDNGKITQSDKMPSFQLQPENKPPFLDRDLN
ncbi:MAG: poly-beta-1,6-N-acetyl-D-glucosamine biosynthesis protein PgaD [Gammaproteobacteria bacterium]|uniref:poly-beta-1,6-N-acetyl-D-glucosamine biosynthesis protein PgaD n=1 Tax=Methylotuvimicrobium sp. TaxID=2822413 RepID=UPI001DE5D778|nr:poly-beta-1,6-N-acetyl-D-glucosamine biosynthesis protein PgaD [Gammaproteobacteria bacterium]